MPAKNEPNLPALLAAAREAEATRPGQWRLERLATRADYGSYAGAPIILCTEEPEDGNRTVLTAPGMYEAVGQHIAAANPAAVLALADLAVRAMRVAVAVNELREAEASALAQFEDGPLASPAAIERVRAARAALPANWRKTLAQFRAELAAID